MKYQISQAKLARQADVFCSLQSIAQFAELLGVSNHEIKQIINAPKYNCFNIPKKDGTFRYIEDPEDDLKAIQRELNDYLQSVYFFNRPPSAYAFLLNPVDDEDTRNILSNAKRHLGKPWMLNADFEDFFYSISEHQVSQIFCNEPFGFDAIFANTLAKLTTFRGRLPMGGSTSPILSNFASIDLDNELLLLAKHKNWTYTRFADDLTFSSENPINLHDIQEIRAISLTNGFRFNEQKLKICSPSAEKEITGIRITEGRLDLPDDYIPKIEKEIERLDTVIYARYRAGNEDSRWVTRYLQQIEGHLRFVSFVLGENHPTYRKLLTDFETAQTPPESYDSVSWLAFSYEKFL